MIGMNRFGIPSIDTCLPSIVSCTSAGLLLVAEKVRAPFCRLACLASRVKDRDSWLRSILASTIQEARPYDAEEQKEGGQQIVMIASDVSAPPILASANHQSADSPASAPAAVA